MANPSTRELAERLELLERAVIQIGAHLSSALSLGHAHAPALTELNRARWARRETTDAVDANQEIR